MALDDFGELNEESSTNNKSNKRHKQESQPNLDNHIQQAFTDDQQVTARAIQSQIKSFGIKWATTFSQLRFENGEKVYYAGSNIGKKSGVTVAVFTTIQSFTSDYLPDDTQDIWIVQWDLKQSDNINEGIYINATEEWEKRLVGAIKEQSRTL